LFLLKFRDLHVLLFVFLRSAFWCYNDDDDDEDDDDDDDDQFGGNERLWGVTFKGLGLGSRRGPKAKTLVS